MGRQGRSVRQVFRYSGIQVFRQGQAGSGRYSDRVRQAGRQAGTQAWSGGQGQAGRHAGRQAGGLDMLEGLPA